MYIDINHASPLWEKTSHRIIEQAVKIVVKSLKLPQMELSILLADETKIKLLNQEFRERETSTNVLSFPQHELTVFKYDHLHENMLLGDIVFAYEIILQEARQQSIAFEDHLTHLTIHGFLHILGFDHMTDEDALQMEQLEIKLLNQLNIQNPYA